MNPKVAGVPLGEQIAELESALSSLREETRKAMDGGDYKKRAQLDDQTRKINGELAVLRTQMAKGHRY